VEIEQLNRTQRLGLRIDTSNEKLTALLGKDYSDYRRSWEEAGRDGNLAPSFPLHLDLELQDSCNQACVMCPRNEERHSSLPYGINLKNTTQIERIKTIISDGSKLGLKSINFGAFSEPLLHKGLWDLISYSHSNGIIDSRVITNGLLLSRYVQEVFASGLRHLFISLDAFTETTYKQIRGVGFRKILESVEMVLLEREKRKSTLPIVRVSFVEMDINRHEKDDFVNFWSEKVDFVDVQEWSDYTTKSDMASISDIPKKFNCRSPWQRLSILADGNILPCCDFNGRALPLGNIAKNNLEDVWKSEEMKNVRLNIINDSSEVCSSCQRGKGV
jgi:radical SAM protein with 4Fe4S-binding SPASM domain